MKADPATINRLLRTARGQLDGILRMVEENQYCLDVSHQLLACEAILKKANREIISSHMRSCVKEAFESGSSEKADQKIDEIIELMAKMAK